MIRRKYLPKFWMPVVVVANGQSRTETVKQLSDNQFYWVMLRPFGAPRRGPIERSSMIQFL